MSAFVRKIHNLAHPKMGYIWMLHCVASHPSDDYLVVTAKYLEKTIDNDLRSGYEAVSLDEAKRRISKKEKSRFVCYTFDDGYLDTFTLAYPIFKARQIPFCVYMTRDFYQKKATPHWNPKAEMMGVEQLLALASDPLCTIGAHTCSHPHLSSLSVEEQRCEINDCKTDLECLLRKPVRHFAYPYGDYDKQTLLIVKELGFETAVTTSGRPLRNDARMLELDRVTLRTV